jgi:hypothetical protein
LARHLPDQTLNASRPHERRRWFRLRILGVFSALQRDQAGDLVLLVLRLVNATPAVGGPRPQAPPIHLHGDHRRRPRHARRQFPPPAPRDLLVADSCQVRADLLR